MRINIKITSLFLLTLLLTCVSFAESTSINPPFSAICECVKGHAYRHGTDILGNPMPDEWSTNEDFRGSKWKFIYTGNNSIVIDGLRIPILAQHPGVIIAGKGSSNGIGASIWTYAIHLGLKKIVASQVNAFGGFLGKSQGLKTRSVNLKCKFDIHETGQ